MSDSIPVITDHRTLDAQIAEQVLGFRWLLFPAGRCLVAPTHSGFTSLGTPTGKEPIHPNLGNHIPPFSSAIANAWQIVEAFQRGWQNHEPAIVTLTVYGSLDPTDEVCECTITASDLPTMTATANTMSLAICRAALQLARRAEP